MHWSDVRLSTLLIRAVPTAAATAVRFRFFDGTYTESLTLEQARLDDVIVALQMPQWANQPRSRRAGQIVRRPDVRLQEHEVAFRH